MQFRTYINHRINLESSKAPNQSLSSSSGEEHNVAAPNLSSARLSDDISIPRHSPPVGQTPSLPDYACPPSPTGQEVSHSSLERTLWISFPDGDTDKIFKATKDQALSAPACSRTYISSYKLVRRLDQFGCQNILSPCRKNPSGVSSS